MKRVYGVIICIALILGQLLLLQNLGLPKNTPGTNEENQDWVDEQTQGVWEDAIYFPIPLSSQHPDYTFSFEDTWMEARTYGGERGHEGVDIMTSNNKRGVYPVISSCDGVVEKKGWLEMGGYRIGIRAAHGGYFYYAHLESYASDIETGDEVYAGQLLGFVGDSGYGEEGTTGQFPVHLHFGIYLTDNNGEETSINPYSLLLHLEENELTFQY